MNNEFSNTTRLMLCGLAIALNIVLGIVAAALKLPFYLDTMGTVLIAVYFGPWYGAAVGGATNFFTSIFTNIAGMPFMLVSIIIGLVVGFTFRKVKFTFVSALVIGVVLAIVSPLVGTPIGIAVYGGLTGTVSDVFVLWLKQSGTGIFAASFIPKLFNNFIDKVPTLLIVYFVILALPWSMKPKCWGGKSKAKQDIKRVV